MSESVSADEKTPADPELPQIQVVGMGLSGLDSLSPDALAVVQAATLVIGSPRHLQAFHRALQRWESSDETETWPLVDFAAVFDRLRSHLTTHPQTRAVVLATGDPLFFGIGRLLLAAFAPEQLVFHPQVSALQLAFSRLKVPWQDATLVSVHGRSEQPLMQALKRGDPKIGVLTDGVFTPGAIANLIAALDVPMTYQLWVCENLGGESESVRLQTLDSNLVSTGEPIYAALNVVVLLRQSDETAGSSLDAATTEKLPLIGLPDAVFKSFPDRPTLMTKREIRLLALGELAPLPGETVWDVGAGTGAISVELSRLCPSARIFAIEKTAMGAALIRANAEKFAIAPIQVIHGRAPDALSALPAPNCVFIGGSSGQLVSILARVSEVTQDEGAVRVVLAIATIEHLSEVMTWSRAHENARQWTIRATQINISRSLPVGPLTRFSPLNPITLVTLEKRRI
ncbi:MAG: precorrin-6y C5,15-methyltransferase (decarboxylating) subunit CbiE [Cyanobacteria bacterium J06614_10]